MILLVSEDAQEDVLNKKEEFETTKWQSIAIVDCSIFHLLSLNDLSRSYFRNCASKVQV